MRRLRLPRPRLVNVIELVESIERLADAASRDMAAYMGEAMSSVALGPKAPGVHSIRTKQVLTRF